MEGFGISRPLSRSVCYPTCLCLSKARLDQVGVLQRVKWNIPNSLEEQYDVERVMSTKNLTSSRFANTMQSMRVIKRGTLNECIKTHPKAAAPLNAWYDHVSMKTTDWRSFADVRRDYRTADKVGNCFVFDIGGNDYRLVVRILGMYVYILKFMTHSEYNKDTWKSECGCDRPRPKKKIGKSLKAGIKILRAKKKRKKK